MPTSTPLDIHYGTNIERNPKPSSPVVPHSSALKAIMQPTSSSSSSKRSSRNEQNKLPTLDNHGEKVIKSLQPEINSIAKLNCAMFNCEEKVANIQSYLSTSTTPPWIAAKMKRFVKDNPIMEGAAEDLAKLEHMLLSNHLEAAKQKQEKALEALQRETQRTETLINSDLDHSLRGWNKDKNQVYSDLKLHLESSVRGAISQMVHKKGRDRQKAEDKKARKQAAKEQMEVDQKPLTMKDIQKTVRNALNQSQKPKNDSGRHQKRPPQQTRQPRGQRNSRNRSTSRGSSGGTRKRSASPHPKKDKQKAQGSRTSRGVRFQTNS